MFSCHHRLHGHLIYYFQIVGGPQVVIQLCANVTMPDMQISTDVLDFSDVTCGQCKVITVQLYNHQHVPCEWNSIPSEKDRVKVRNTPGGLLNITGSVELLIV